MLIRCQPLSDPYIMTHLIFITTVGGKRYFSSILWMRKRRHREFSNLPSGTQSASGKLERQHLAVCARDHSLDLCAQWAA